MLRSDGGRVTQDWPGGWKGGSRLEQLEFTCHVADTTEHCVPVCTALSLGLCLHPSARYREKPQSVPEQAL